MRSVVLCSIVCAVSALGQVREDTARLQAQLQQHPGHKTYELQPAQYKTIQNELLAWIDTRLREGKGGSAMNAELKTAGLLSDGPQDVDDYDKTYAGYLGGVTTSSMPEAPDLLEVTFGVFTGGYCNDDSTAVLYTRTPFRRLAVLNAEPVYSHGALLRTLTADKPDNAGRRTIASAWVASTCTSNWNGENLRIDRLTGEKLTPLTNQPIPAFAGDPVKITLVDDAVIVRYTTQDGNAHLIPAVERYRVEGDRAVRLSSPRP